MKGASVLVRVIHEELRQVAGTGEGQNADASGPDLGSHLIGFTCCRPPVQPKR